MSRMYPCDINDRCPYDATSSGFECRNYCGLGCDDEDDDWLDNSELDEDEDYPLTDEDRAALERLQAEEDWLDEYDDDSTYDELSTTYDRWVYPVERSTYSAVDDMSRQELGAILKHLRG